MVTRRQSLSIIISSLLLPIVDKVALAQTAGISRLRVTDPGCTNCFNTAALKDVFANVLESAAVLKDVALPLSLIPITRSLKSGIAVQYVESFTGTLAFAVKDLELLGKPGILAVRNYSNVNTVDSGLGPGWSLGVDDKIVVNGNDASFQTSAGNIVALTVNKSLNTLTPIDPAFSNFKSGQFQPDGSILEHVGPKILRRYTLIAGAYFLSAVELTGQRQIAIKRNALGRVTSVEGAPNEPSISFLWSSDANPRLLAISDSTGRGVSFSFVNGVLASVTDVAGSIWTYNYDSNDQLAAVIDPEATAILQATYDGQKVKSIETMDGRFHFGYSNSNATTQMVATDSNGTSTSYSHNANGQIVSAASGTSSIVLAYDDYNRLVSVASPENVIRQFAYDGAGRVTELVQGKKRWTRRTYDASGNLIGKSDPAGSVFYAYDANGNPTQARSARASRSYTATYEGGRLKSLTSAKYSVTHNYDTQGHLITVVDAKRGTYQYGYSAQGWLMTEQLPTGYRSQSTRDARGQVLQWRDSNNNQITYVRDKRGALTEIHNTSGDWAKAERDSQGRIVTLTNSRGQARSFAYDSVGRLESYRDAINRSFALTYTSQAGYSKAQSMIQTNGEAALVRGPHGAVVATTRTALAQVAGITSSPSSFTAPLAPPTGETNAAEDGWYDPLYGKGLLGSFSGYTVVAVAADASIVATPQGLMDDDDDAGDDSDNTVGLPIGDDSDTGDGEADGSDSPLHPLCQPCVSQAEQNCIDQAQAAVNSNFYVVGAAELIACTGVGIAGLAFPVVGTILFVACTATATAQQTTSLNDISTTYSDCLGSIVAMTCASQCSG